MLELLITKLNMIKKRGETIFNFRPIKNTTNRIDEASNGLSKPCFRKS